MHRSKGALPLLLLLLVAAAAAAGAAAAPGPCAARAVNSSAISFVDNLIFLANHKLCSATVDPIRFFCGPGEDCYGRYAACKRADAQGAYPDLLAPFVSTAIGLPYALHPGGFVADREVQGACASRAAGGEVAFREFFDPVLRRVSTCAAGGAAEWGDPPPYAVCPGTACARPPTRDPADRDRVPRCACAPGRYVGCDGLCGSRAAWIRARELPPPPDSEVPAEDAVCCDAASNVRRYRDRDGRWHYGCCPAGSKPVPVVDRAGFACCPEAAMGAVEATHNSSTPYTKTACFDAANLYPPVRWPANDASARAAPAQDPWFAANAIRSRPGGDPAIAAVGSADACYWYALERPPRGGVPPQWARWDNRTCVVHYAAPVERGAAAPGAAAAHRTWVLNATLATPAALAALATATFDDDAPSSWARGGPRPSALARILPALAVVALINASGRGALRRILAPWADPGRRSSPRSSGPLSRRPPGARSA